MIFDAKYFSRYILLTDQISLSDYIYFFRFWAMHVLELFVPVSDIINFEISQGSLVKAFLA